MVSILQAVGTVATVFVLVSIDGIKVSILQAVGTVATLSSFAVLSSKSNRFNTASGKHCCNSHSS